MRGRYSSIGGRQIRVLTLATWSPQLDAVREHAAEGQLRVTRSRLFQPVTPHFFSMILQNTLRTFDWCIASLPAPTWALTVTPQTPLFLRNY